MSQTLSQEKLSQENRQRQQNPSHASCENCGHVGLVAFEIETDHELLFCKECLLYQKSVLPFRDSCEADFHRPYPRRRDSKIVTGLVRLNALTKYIETDHVKMLDIGCSAGATLAAAERLGWQATGVDVSETAVEASRRIGLDCHTITDHRLPFEDDCFDVVTSWHVIEHVTDVRQTLTEWMRVVKPGGILALETPDSQCWKARWQGPRYQKFWPKEHLYTFTRSNMCSLLEQVGFEVLPSRIMGSPNTLPFKVSAYAAAYRSWRQLNRKLRFCKSIEVCCRKPLENVSDARLQPAKAAA